MIRTQNKEIRDHSVPNPLHLEQGMIKIQKEIATHSGQSLFEGLAARSHDSTYHVKKEEIRASKV